MYMYMYMYMYMHFYNYSSRTKKIGRMAQGHGNDHQPVFCPRDRC
jgi:uncharacterized protein YqhQ